MAIYTFWTIPNEIIRLFNCCLTANYFPQAWKEAEIRLIRKNNTKPIDHNSYRPISLLPIIGKVLDRLLTQRINWHLEKTNYLNDKQFGFRTHRNTLQAIQKIVDYIQTAKSQKEHTAIITLDFQGAFNRAWTPLILTNLRETKCPKNIFGTLKSYLNNRKASVLFNSGEISVQEVSGCPQGSCLGPTLWNILYNSIFQLENSLPEGTLLQGFADDTVIATTHKSRDRLEEKINLCLEKIHNWCVENKITINPNKCESMVVGKNRPLSRRISTKINGERIPSKKEIKYLGILIDERLSWTPHIHWIQKKGKKILNILRSLVGTTWGMGSEAIKTIYNVAVVPAITYGAEIWGAAAIKNRNRQILNSIQRPALISMTKAYRTSPTNGLQVIGRTMPIVLKIKQIYLTSHIKQGKEVTDLDVSEDSKDNIKILTKLINDHGLERHYNKPLHPAFHLDILFNTAPPKFNTLDLYIFTDGSRSEKGTGSGVVFYDGNFKTLFQGYYKLADYSSVVQAELFAIFQGVKEITNKIMKYSNYRNYYICSDSRTALNLLANNKKHNSLARNIHDYIYNNNQGSKFKFIWVKGHSDLKGNDQADKLAKQATKLGLNVSYSKVPESYLKNKINSILISEWQREWEIDDKGRHVFKFIPSISKFLQNKHFKITHQLTQLLTGHGGLNAYLRRFNIQTNENCDCGQNVPQTVDHLLFWCPHLDNDRTPLERRVLLDGHNWPCEGNTLIDNRKIFLDLLTFLENTNLFHTSS